MPTTEDRYWQACLERDASFDGRVILAVRTTGIYCRPSCPARKPRRENVAFFALPELARRAGYRPCKRCRPLDAGGGQQDPGRRAARNLGRAPRASGRDHQNPFAPYRG